MKYKYVIFDCDGVLVDSEYLACKTLSDMLSIYGPVISPEHIMSEYVGMKDVQVINILNEEYNLKLPENFILHYEKTLDAKLALNLDAIPGIDTILKNIKIPIALVSNSNYSRIITSVTSAKLIQHFDSEKIFGADRAGFAKPDPRIYLYALEKLGIHPEQAIVIEDSPTGVSASCGAGIETIGFLAASHSSQQESLLIKNGARHIAYNCQDLTAILKTKNLV